MPLIIRQEAKKNTAPRMKLAMHEAAKKAFDRFDGVKFPTAAQIQAEFSSLLAEKKKLYEACKATRREMIEFQTAMQNIDRILNAMPEPKKRGNRNADKKWNGIIHLYGVILGVSSDHTVPLFSRSAGGLVLRDKKINVVSIMRR